MSKTKKSLWLSAVSMMLCALMLLGTTFAWFTDSVTNTGNVIQAGNLDVKFEYRDLTSAGDYQDVTNDTPLFNDVTWEPGKSFGYDFKVANAGSLAFDWELSFQNIKSEGGTNDVNIADVLDVYFTTDEDAMDLTDAKNKGTLANLSNGVVTTGTIKRAGGPYMFSVVLKMKEDAGNDYQGAKVTFDVVLRAKQANVEEDGFGSSDYDAEATFPATSGKDLVSGLQNGGVVSVTEDLIWDEAATIASDTQSVLNLESGKTVTVTKDGIADLYGNAQLTIQGTGKLNQDMGSEIGYLIRATGESKVIIKDGTFIGGLTCVQADKNAQVEIYGGHFEALVDWHGTYWLLNLVDNTNASIKVYGGTFVNFDPSNSKTENPAANFVAEGYTVVSEKQANGDIWYTVVPE